MGHSYSIFIGTVGNGLQYSRDGGETWEDAATGDPYPNHTVAGLEGNVRALSVYPNDPHRILAGTDWTGIYRSDDNGESWNHIKSPMEGMEIWSIDVDPTDPDKIYVGTRPQGFRSSDGGESWEKMEIRHRRERSALAAAHHQDHSRSQGQPHHLGGRRGGRRPQELGRRRLVGATARRRPQPVLRRHPLHGHQRAGVQGFRHQPLRDRN